MKTIAYDTETTGLSRHKGHEMFGYSTRLRSITRGRATYTMESSHFERVSDEIAERLLS